MAAIERLWLVGLPEHRDPEYVYAEESAARGHAEIVGGAVVEYVPVEQLRGAVGLIARWTIWVCPTCGNKSPRHRGPCLSDDPPGLRPVHEKIEVVPADQLRGAVEERDRLRAEVERLREQVARLVNFGGQ